MQFVDDNTLTDRSVITYYNKTHTGNRVMEQKTIIHKYVPVGQKEIKHEMMRPSIPMEFWEMMHDFSMFLIVDDRHDLGKFNYYDRHDHYYRFKKAPDHPSPFHHYQVGIVGLFLSQVGALLSKALDIQSELAGMQQPPIPEVYKLPKKEKIITIPQPLSLPEAGQGGSVGGGGRSPVFAKLTKALDSI